MGSKLLHFAKFLRWPLVIMTVLLLAIFWLAHVPYAIEHKLTFLSGKRTTATWVMRGLSTSSVEMLSGRTYRFKSLDSEFVEKAELELKSLGLKKTRHFSDSIEYEDPITGTSVQVSHTSSTGTFLDDEIEVSIGTPRDASMYWEAKLVAHDLLYGRDGRP